MKSVLKLHQNSGSSLELFFKVLNLVCYSNHLPEQPGLISLGFGWKVALLRMIINASMLAITFISIVIVEEKNHFPNHNRSSWGGTLERSFKIKASFLRSAKICHYSHGASQLQLIREWTEQTVFVKWNKHTFEAIIVAELCSVSLVQRHDVVAAVPCLCHLEVQLTRRLDLSR